MNNNPESWNNAFKSELEGKNLNHGEDIEGDKSFPYLERLILPSMKIVEAGCGSGRILKKIARLEDIEVTGIDFSEILVDSTNKMLHALNLTNAKALCGNILNLSIDDREFDVYSSFGVYEHFKKNDHKQLFSEAYRVLKKDGILFLEVPYLYSPWTLRRKIRSIYRSIRPPKLIFQRNLSRSYLIKCAKNAGFTDINTKVINSYAAFNYALTLNRGKIHGIPNPFFYLRKGIKSICEKLDNHEMMGLSIILIAYKRE